MAQRTNATSYNKIMYGNTKLFSSSRQSISGDLKGVTDFSLQMGRKENLFEDDRLTDRF